MLGRRDKRFSAVAWYVLVDMDKDCEMETSRLVRLSGVQES
jgi:hypothetical protein